MDNFKLNEAINTLLEWQYGDYEFCKEACLRHNCDLEKIMADFGA